MPATDADLALVKRAFEEFDVGHTDIEDYYSRFWHPEAEIEAVDGFPVPGKYHGFEGYQRWFADSYGPYENIERRVDSITIEGERVVVLLTITGHPKGDDLELEIKTGSTYEVEDGRIKRLCVYVGHERAILAARTS